MVSVMLYPCILCVALLMDFFVLCVACLTVFVNFLVKQFAICLGLVIILLLNVMEGFSVGRGALLDRPRNVHIVPVIPVCHLSVPSIGFVIFFVCRRVISSFKNLRAGSQVFALLMLFLCVILHNMWSDKSLELLCILPFGMLCLSAIRMMFVKIMYTVCMLVGMVV